MFAFPAALNLDVTVRHLRCRVNSDEVARHGIVQIANSGPWVEGFSPPLSLRPDSRVGRDGRSGPPSADSGPLRDPHVDISERAEAAIGQDRGGGGPLRRRPRRRAESDLDSSVQAHRHAA